MFLAGVALRLGRETKRSTPKINFRSCGQLNCLLINFLMQEILLDRNLVACSLHIQTKIIFTIFVV